MQVKILKDVMENGISLKPGDVIDDSVIDIENMMELIRTGTAVEVKEIDAEMERDVQKNDKFTAKELSDFCNEAVENNWGYVWGGRGFLYNESERDYLYRTYRTSKYDRKYYYTTQWKRWGNHHVCDCSGFIEAFSGINKTANGFYNSCEEKGSISSFPKKAGYLVFRYSSSSKKMVHVGVYDGGEKVIESKDSATGVAKTSFSSGRWTHWGKPGFIDFLGDDPKEKFTLSRLLRLSSPHMKGTDVKDVQNALEDAGYSVGKFGIDGVYGNDTYNATKRFQKANGLVVDGIVGPLTVRKLGGVWTGK